MSLTSHGESDAASSYIHEDVLKVGSLYLLNDRHIAVCLLLTKEGTLQPTDVLYRVSTPSPAYSVPFIRELLNCL